MLTEGKLPVDEKAVKTVQRVTGTDKVNGENLLGSPEPKRQLRQSRLPKRVRTAASIRFFKAPRYGIPCFHLAIARCESHALQNAMAHDIAPKPVIRPLGCITTKGIQPTPTASANQKETLRIMI